jgi:histidine triad (HIT) family protein
VHTSEADCPFCEIVGRDDPDAREVYRDQQVVAFFPPEPATLGHTLVIPRDHIPDIWSLDAGVAAQLARVIVRLARVMQRALQPEGLNVIQSNGAVATQTVAHLHVHVVPRWADDELGQIWPPETAFTERQKDAAWEALRSECLTEMHR